MTLDTAIVCAFITVAVVLLAYAALLFREVGHQIRTDRAYTREVARLRKIRFKPEITDAQFKRLCGND